MKLRQCLVLFVALDIKDLEGGWISEHANTFLFFLNVPLTPMLWDSTLWTKLLYPSLLSRHTALVCKSMSVVGEHLASTTARFPKWIITT
jgi:hypothetical protein